MKTNTALAETHAHDLEGQTALLFANVAGHEKTVQALIDKGADVHARDSEGQSALSFAAAEGHEKIIQTLGNSVVNLIMAGLIQ